MLVAVGTGYRGWREQPDGPQAALAEARRWLAGAGGQDYEKLRAEHPADHHRLSGVRQEKRTALRGCQYVLYGSVASRAQDSKEHDWQLTGTQ
ncbi:hypothetical protein GCM10010193_26040 [Kitasatospora atroaurantiaca]